MCRRRYAVARLATHPHRRRIRRRYLGMRRLYRLQFTKQAVVFGIREFGPVFDIVKVFVPSKFFAKSFNRRKG